MNKNQTNLCKGVAVLLLLFHHLFYQEADAYSVTALVLTGDSVLYLAQICKVCVSIFVFLTGYGYMRSEQMRRKKTDGTGSIYLEVTGKRYFRLMSEFWFVFIPALVINIIVRDGVYGSGDVIEKVINMIIDGLGWADIFETPTLNATWWYMSYALFLVLITPLVVRLSEKVGFLLIPMALIIPHYVSFDNRYLLALILGIVCAKYLVFERIYRISAKIKSVDIFLIVWLSIFMAIVRQEVGYYEITEAVMAMGICYLAIRVISQATIVFGVLSCLGKYSMDIFLTHTFIYYYFFKDFIYSFKYVGAIFLVLLCCSFLLAVFIEKLKKLLGYDKFEKKAVQYIEKIARCLGLQPSEVN